MLALTRKPGESIIITAGDVQIVVRVVAVLDRDTRPRVRLAFDAPLEVQIDREELAARKAAGGE